MRRLILFDIDGTLLTTDGVAGRAFRAALETVFGTSGPARGYSFAGKTDPQIARDLLLAAGVEEPTIDARLPQVWQHYTPVLERDIDPAATKVFPGVRELTAMLHEHPDAILGLLTGNLREGARIKLAAADIDFNWFQVGAFGSDHAQRRELPALAINRAEERFGRRFEGKDVVIIGDTPLDVACGEHLGVRTIAVATGTYSEDQLRECGPDYLFASLADTQAVWRAIFD
ncbi:MAG: HAD hydrolase-like protein [Gemmatimonadetes bacterium]|nr:HAD hydrolase-like protein [Gemmatimonadota bacterium]